MDGLDSRALPGPSEGPADAERDDGALIALIALEDRDALGCLYDRYSSAVYSLSLHVLRDSCAAEEVTQDTFFNVWRRARSYQPTRGTVRAWLFSIAHHRSIDELRRRRRAREHAQPGVDIAATVADESADPVAYAAERFDRRMLAGALGTLRPEQRQIVELAFFGGMTHSEISRHLDQPLGTVKTRMRLGLRKLREVLGRQGKGWAQHGLHGS